MKTVVILQSNYIPWKGYFDLLHDADEFILYDDAQYTKNDWRNRNQLKSAKGLEWLSIPVVNRFGQRIDETCVADARWSHRHWQKIASLYGNAPHFATHAPRLEALYARAGAHERLSGINRLFLEGIAEALGISTPLTWSTEYPASGRRTERLISLCTAAGATRYISGPAAKNYIEPALFEDAGIELVFKDYGGYPEYPQAFPPFAHSTSILDLLFNTGPAAAWHIWGWRNGPAPT